MRDYRWFKIVVRAIGLLLLGQSIPYVASATEWIFAALNQPGSVPGLPYLERGAIYGAGALGEVLLGLYLLSGAPKFVRYCIDQVDRRCIRCDYDLTGLTGTCPECGTPIPLPPSPTQP